MHKMSLLVLISLFLASSCIRVSQKLVNGDPIGTNQRESGRSDPNPNAPCNENPETMFADEYLEGSIVALAFDDEYGFISISHDHDYTYLVLYRGEELSANKLYQKVFIKVHSICDIPFAHSIKKNLPPGELEHHGKSETKIPYHNFFDHGGKLGFHKKFHIVPASTALTGPEPPQSETGNYPAPPEGAFSTQELQKVFSFVFTENGQETDRHYGVGLTKYQYELYGVGMVHVEVYAGTKWIKDINVCHIHNGERSDCRDGWYD